MSMSRPSGLRSDPGSIRTGGSDPRTVETAGQVKPIKRTQMPVLDRVILSGDETLTR